MIDIAKAKKITGWMEPEELLWLAKQANKHERIVEIGSFMGRSTRALADNTPGFVETVDDFFGPIENVITDDIRPSIFPQFMSNMEDLVAKGKVRVQQEDHMHVYVDFVPDMVFIDGSHIYQDVANDIFIWRERLAPGGLICGHDIQFPDVRRAVDEVLGEYRIAKNTTIWYIDKPK
jgi:predicted O-methyltransferase YrrM